MNSLSIGPTLFLANRAASVEFERLPTDVVEIATQCVLDFFAVALSGSRSDPVRLLTEVALEEGGAGASIIGSGLVATPFWASWVNGAAAHVYVYDDVNMAIPGHGSATTLPAVLALTQQTAASGSQAIAAFVAGYEVSCAIGKAISPSHYGMGYHASSTIGSFGATAAAGRILGLTGAQIAEAFGIASSMASGFKGVFGTMAKCVQVGRTSPTGIAAARLAKRGMTSGATILEHPQGFVRAQSTVDPSNLDFSAGAGTFALRNNLFKYYAACYMANAPIECASRLRLELNLPVEAVEHMDIIVNPSVGSVCNIDRPITPLEAKYSVRTVVAMSLNDISPAQLDNFERVAADYGLVEDVVRRTAVVFDAGHTETQCTIRMSLRNGDILERSFDAGLPEIDLSVQRARLSEKFDSFVTPILGASKTARLKEEILALPTQKTLDPIFELL